MVALDTIDQVLRDFQIQMLPAEVPSRIGTSLSVTVGPKIQKFGIQTKSNLRFKTVTKHSAWLITKFFFSN